MKFSFLVVLLFSFVGYTSAETATGFVEEIRYHNAEVVFSRGWNEMVWFRFEEDKHPCSGISIDKGNEIAISMLLAAKMSGREVTAEVDTTKEFPEGTGYCQLQYLTIN